jgi:site-specific DNA recombinase
LGYDIDAQGSKLWVNEAETARVRAIFALFLELRTLRSVVRELDRRGWRTKRWRTQPELPEGFAWYRFLPGRI